jgi:hypothetical protein
MVKKMKMASKRTASALAAAGLLALTGCGSPAPAAAPTVAVPTFSVPVTTPSAKTTPTADAKSKDCLDATAAAASIAEGLHDDVKYTGKAAAVKSKDYKSAYMVALSISTPETPDDIGVYVVGDLNDTTSVHSADAVSALYANWPQTIDASKGLKFSAGDHGVAASKACLK